MVMISSETLTGAAEAGGTISPAVAQSARARRHHADLTFMLPRLPTPILQNNLGKGGLTLPAAEDKAAWSASAGGAKAIERVVPAGLIRGSSGQESMRIDLFAPLHGD